MHVPRTCHARAHAHAGHLHSMHTHMGTRHAHAHAHAMRMPCTRHAHAHAPRRRGPRRTSRCGPRPGRGARSGGPRGPPLATRPSRYGLAPPSPPCHAGATPRTARSRRRSSCPAIDRSRDRQLGITRCTPRALHGSAMLGPSQPRHPMYGVHRCRLSICRPAREAQDPAQPPAPQRWKTCPLPKDRRGGSAAR